MQLPRGSFYRIFKGITQSSLFHEMQHSGFTGTCTIAIASERGVLVVEGGTIVLAEYRHCIGQTALDEMQKSGDIDVSAELNAFTAAQMKLAREFNQGCTIRLASQESRKTPIKDALPGKMRNPVPGEKAGFVKAHSAPKKVVKERPETPNRSGGAMPAARSVKMPENSSSPPDQAGTREAGDAAPDGDDVNMLVERMEKMDVETIISSFRGNCKDMLRRMQLDHLIQDIER